MRWPIIISLAWCCFTGILAVPITYYVSPAGNDAWSGRLAQANRTKTDGPFATITHARDAVRMFNQAARGETAVQVVLRGGTYPLPETLTFTEVDGGSAACPVTYAAYPGEQPIISGGRRITGWRDGTINGKACWVAELPDAQRGAWNFTQLFVNGRRAPRTRLPKTGFFRFADGTSYQGEPYGSNGPTAARVNPGDVKVWANLSDVDVTVLQHWVEKHLRLKSVDEQAGQVTFVAPGSSLQDETGKPARYCVENVREALDTPGQWYLDRPTGTLYYLPLPGEARETVEIIAPRLDCLLRVQGSDAVKVQSLRFEHLDFQYAEWRYPPVDTGSSQAASSVPGAITLENGEDCACYGCTISRIATYGIEVGKGCARTRIIACEIADMGAGGVKVAPGSERTTISDCAIHDGGVIFPSAVGVWVGNSGRNRILHNHIYNLYYTGISCGWSWGYQPTATLDNRIEYNHIHDIGRGLLSDMGGIYTLGLQPGGIIRGNVIHDVTKYGYGGWGIYPDEGTSEVLIENNLTYRTDNAGFGQHYGRDVLARNNIFASAKEEQINRGKQEAHRSMVFTRNIVYVRGSEQMLGGYNNKPFLQHCDFVDNLYWRVDGGAISFDGLSFANWQQTGRDRGSLLADPLFVNPDAGDFNLRNGSPAAKIGFQPFDYRIAGPRLIGKRPLHLDDWPVERETPVTIVQSRLETVAPFVFTETGGTGRARLVVKNIGDTPAAGRVAVLVAPAEAARLPDNPALTFALQPGEEGRLDFAVEVTKPDVAEISIETAPSGDALIPTCLYLNNPVARTWRIPRVATINKPEDIPAALAQVAPHRQLIASDERAVVRLAHAGNLLALQAQVRDTRIDRGTAFEHGGSTVEFFAAPAGEKIIRQLVFLPPVGTTPAQVHSFKMGDRQPAPVLSSLLRPVAGGYEILALIPLSTLGIPEGATEFQMELSVTTTTPAIIGAKRLAFFGTVNSFMDVTGFGRAVFDQ